MTWKIFIPVAFLLVVGVEAYLHYIYWPRHRPPLSIAYVKPATVEVENTPAQVRVPIATLAHDSQVEIVGDYGPWRRIRFFSGREGWVHADALLDQATFQAAQGLLGRVSNLTVQAKGHTIAPINLRVAPRRSAPSLAELPQGQAVKLFERRVAAPANDAVAPASPSDVWYMVRASGEVGWLLGRFVDLDLPSGISIYGEDANIVAWVTLTKISDNGIQVPEYLAADRAYGSGCDYTRVRVFTWAPASQQYATAFVNGGLCGFLPLAAGKTREGLPYFRLRLKDARGKTLQALYEMNDTVVRPIAIVAGWNPPALPPSRPDRFSGSK